MVLIVLPSSVAGVFVHPAVQTMTFYVVPKVRVEVKPFTLKEIRVKLGV